MIKPYPICNAHNFRIGLMRSAHGKPPAALPALAAPAVTLNPTPACIDDDDDDSPALLMQVADSGEGKVATFTFVLAV